MSGRFGHSGHVWRVAVLLAVGLVAFLVIKSTMIPKDFGVLGFYRAGALDDVKAQPIQYAGHQTCEVCHAAVVEARQGSRHEHLPCEGCHGPLAKHADSPTDVKPTKPEVPALCLHCHVKMAGKYEGFPQITPATHYPDGPCTVCHQPHHPKIAKTK
jgi:hypothetical protein